MSIFLWVSTFIILLITIAWRWYRTKNITILSVIRLFLLFTISTLLTQLALTSELNDVTLYPSHALPQLNKIYLALHFTIILCLVLGFIYSLKYQRLLIWLMLLVYSSYLYFRTFFALENGTPYPLLFVIALLAIIYWGTHFGPDTAHESSSPNAFALPISLLVPLAAFLLLTGISTVLSASPDESLTSYFQIVYFAILPFIFAYDLVDSRTWRISYTSIVIFGGLIWVVLAGIKLGILTGAVGFAQALKERVFIAEVGPNWISYPLVILLPLCVGMGLIATTRWRKLAWGVGCVGIVFTIVYTQLDVGYSGWIGLSLGVITMVFLLKWIAIKTWWKNHLRMSPIIIISGIGLIAVIILSLIIIAPRLNSFSFYTRLYGWRTSLYQLADHLLFGSGLGVRHVTAQYGDRASWNSIGASFSWLTESPFTLGSQQLQLHFHTHNNFLEIAVAAGVPALLAFLWFLWMLSKHSLSVFQQATGDLRILMASCIAGIIASLGWGMIDTMEFSPIFFTTPVWLLIGLLLAVPRALNYQPSTGKLQFTAFKIDLPHYWRRLFFYSVCLVLAIFTIILPILGNFHYRLGYVAYQEHRWKVAADEFTCASQWDPLSAKYNQLRGEVFINLGQYDDAISMYKRAVNLKRDFSPYYSQLGWLYWLQGDLDQATYYFKQAVEIDPVEAWRSGLHSDLGLAYIAQGHNAEAIPLLKKSIELEPNVISTSNLVWVPVEKMDGTFDLVVDPVYSLPVNNGTEKRPLHERILAHLGKTDYTTRLFSYDLNFKESDSLLSLNLVLDAIDADYIAAQNINKRESPRLLATVAEAARSAGLYNRAEQAYLLYQLNFPESEYGFRELGIVYRGQGRFPEAQVMLERAIKVKPNDKNSWLALGELYKDREMFSEAISALDKAYHLSPIDSYTSELQALIHRRQGNLSQAANNLKHSLVIAESISNRLILANLYRQLNTPNQAVEQCILATDAFRRTLLLPLDPQLVEIADCLAQSNLTYEELTHLQICKSGNKEICYILIGHKQQARGEYDQALSSYNKAAVNQPEDDSPHYFLGQTYQKLGQLSKAEDEYYQAFKLNPQESLPLLSLAQLQWEQGRQEVAIETLHSAVNATPGWGQVSTALGNALLSIGDLKGAAVNYRLAQVQSGDTSEGVIFDFAAHLADAKIQSPAPNYVRNEYFTILSQNKSNQNPQKRVLFMHPDSSVNYSVTVPENTNLYFDLAVAPDSWRQPGDGVTFSVDVQSEQGTIQVFSVYIDPKNNYEDQQWNSYMIDLSDYAGQTINIVFKTDCGPAEDCRYDWAGWGEPRLLQP